MTTNYAIGPEWRGLNGWGQHFSDLVYSATLAGSTDTSLAVPLTAAMGQATATTKNKFLAVVCTNYTTHPVYWALNATAAVPAGGAFAATTSEMIPNATYFAKTVKAGDTLHFISAGTPDVTVTFYALLE